jgi:glutaredoxin
MAFFTLRAVCGSLIQVFSHRWTKETIYDHRMTGLRCTALVIVFAAGIAAAQPYRWIDENGGVQYTDTLPPAGAKYVEKMQLRDNVIGEQTSYELEKAMRESPVTLYSHPYCNDNCQIARDMLNKRGIPFREVSVEDQPTQDELKRVSGGINVPVLVVGEQVETTISAQAYDRTLDLAGYPRAGVVRPRNQAAPPPTEDKSAGAAKPPAEAEAAPLGPYAPR